MYNPEFRITRDNRSSVFLVFFSATWANFPANVLVFFCWMPWRQCSCFSLLLWLKLLLTQVIVSCSCCWKLMISTFKTLWRCNQIYFVKRLMRIHLSMSSLALGFDKLIEFALSLMDENCRLSSGFTAFRDVLKVVVNIIHHVSNSEARYFFIFDCYWKPERVRNQNWLSNSTKVLNSRKTP